VREGSAAPSTELSLWDMVVRAAAQGGRLSVLRADGGFDSVDYSRLIGEADGIAGGLERAGVQRGDRVGLWAATSLDFVRTVLGIWRAGATAVPIPLPTRRSNVDPGATRRALDLFEVKLLVAGPGSPDPAGSSRTVALDELSQGGMSNRPEPSADGEALLQMTSGSTGTPRGVILRHSAVVAQVESLRDAYGMDDPAHDHYVSWLPLYHDLGLIAFLLRPLCFGVSATLIPPSLFLRDPLVWLRAIDRQRATISGGPNFAYGLIVRRLGQSGTAPRSDMDLSCWKKATCGGEPVEYTTMSRFADALSEYGFPRSALTPGYGLAEATCVVSVSRSGMKVIEVSRRELLESRRVRETPEPEDALPVVSVGPPLPRVEVEIRDEHGTALGEGAAGEIWVSGPTLMDGYADGSHEAVMADGWLATGDLGFLREGEVYVTGRKKDVIIVSGRNLYAEDVERIVQTALGMRGGACAAFAVPGPDTESLIVAVEAELNGEEVALGREIRRVVLGSLGVSPRDVWFLSKGDLPKTTSGKLRRSETRKRFLAQRS
jgi:fatty-acyl-CoA synthase